MGNVSRGHCIAEAVADSDPLVVGQHHQAMLAIVAAGGVRVGHHRQQRDGLAVVQANVAEARTGEIAV